MPSGHAVDLLNSDIDGLSDLEASSRLRIFGPNVLSSTKPPSWWKLLLLTLPNPFNILLTLLAIISVVTPQRNWVSCAPALHTWSLILTEKRKHLLFSL
jgi:Mg2+-importing ATPase